MLLKLERFRVLDFARLQTFSESCAVYIAAHLLNDSLEIQKMAKAREFLSH